MLRCEWSSAETRCLWFFSSRRSSSWDSGDPPNSLWARHYSFSSSSPSSGGTGTAKPRPPPVPCLAATSVRVHPCRLVRADALAWDRRPSRAVCTESSYDPVGTVDCSISGAQCPDPTGLERDRLARAASAIAESLGSVAVTVDATPGGANVTIQFADRLSAGHGSSVAPDNGEDPIRVRAGCASDEAIRYTASRYPAPRHEVVLAPVPSTVDPESATSRPRRPRRSRQAGEAE